MEQQKTAIEGDAGCGAMAQDLSEDQAQDPPIILLGSWQVLAYLSKLSPAAAAALLSKAKPVKVEEVEVGQGGAAQVRQVPADVDSAEAAAKVMRALAAGHHLSGIACWKL